MSSNDIEENASEAEKISSEPDAQNSADAEAQSTDSDEENSIPAEPESTLSPELLEARKKIMDALGHPKDDAPTLDERLANKTNYISELLAYKETLLLSYVDVEVPFPYYDNWRREANETFAQAVRISQRRRALAEETAKAASEEAKKAQEEPAATEESSDNQSSDDKVPAA